LREAAEIGNNIGRKKQETQGQAFGIR
jgi:hypothetical protein